MSTILVTTGSYARAPNDGRTPLCEVAARAQNGDVVTFSGGLGHVDLEHTRLQKLGMRRLGGRVREGNVNAALATDVEIALPRLACLAAGDFVL